uniref:IP08417p n=1 Tax=Drosophila melanogaster TaxID=7227 RepID=Q4V4A0_DROME
MRLHCDRICSLDPGANLAARMVSGLGKRALICIAPSLCIWHFPTFPVCPKYAAKENVLCQLADYVYYLSLSVLIISSGVLYMLAGFLIVSLAFVLCTLIAALMAYDLTGTGLYLYALATGTYSLSIYSLVLYVVLDVIWGFYLFAFCIGCVVMMFLMYHVQCIMGGRRASTKLFDDKFAALLLFHEFIGLFVLTLYWRPIMHRLQLKQ